MSHSLTGASATAAGSLRTEGIVKRFAEVAAVDHVDLELPAGRFFSLLGPSGCGKTTLLRMIAGLEQPDAGRILADGADITRRPPEARPFNMVFQRYALFPHLTVAGNITFGLTTDRKSRPPKAAIATRVGDALELVGMTGYADRFPAQLSGGQQQRVAVARALVRRPRVLLLDEPMAALDRNVRHQVREELLRLHRETATTFLMVTHDQEEALSISQTVALMNAGRLEQVADPQTLYSAPASLFAARFIGAGSFVAAQVTQPGSRRLIVDALGIRFSPEAAAGATGAAWVQVLLRPNETTLADPGAGRVDGVVQTCTFFGAYFEITITTRLGLLRLHHTAPVAPGATVGIGWPDEAGIAYPSPHDSHTPVPADDMDPAEAGVKLDRGAGRR